MRQFSFGFFRRTTSRLPDVDPPPFFLREKAVAISLVSMDRKLVVMWRAGVAKDNSVFLCVPDEHRSCMDVAYN